MASSSKKRERESHKGERLKRGYEMKPESPQPVQREKRDKYYTIPPIRTPEDEVKYEKIAYSHLIDTNGIITEETFTYLFHVRDGWKRFLSEKKAINLFLKKYNNLGRYWLVWKEKRNYRLAVFLEKDKIEYEKKYEKLREDHAEKLDGYEGVRNLFNQTNIPQYIVKQLIQQRVRELWNSMTSSEIEKEEYDPEIK